MWVGFWLLVAGVAAGDDTAELRFVGGLASQEELIERFVAALENDDKAALLSLLVSAEQYRDSILPGSVEPGQPDRTWPEKSRQFFTDNFFHKSGLYADNLLSAWGGRKIQMKRVYFTRDPKQYARYHARGELRIAVEVDPPVDVEPIIRTGFIAEANGTYKFLGFLYDDD